MNSSHKKILFLNGLLLTVLLYHSVYRDIQLETQYPSDLRNRVVGARLQKDGRLPYNYYWQPSDGSRYYDPANHNMSSSGISNVTASPFFHELLFPLCDKPQRLISIIWLIMEYVFLFAMIFIFCDCTENKWIIWLLINTGVLFTATEGWKDLISVGQLYLFEAFLMCCIIALMIRNKKPGMLVAGVLAAVFILTRPIGLVIFIPFLFEYKRYTVFLLTSLLGLLIYGAYVLTNPGERSLYNNYISMMKLQVAFHQAEAPAPAAAKIDTIKYNDFEGFRFDEVHRSESLHPIKVYSESGNVFVLYTLITHKKLSVQALNIISAITLLLTSVLFYLEGRKHRPGVLQSLIFAFTLYMIAELFNPVHRHAYNSVQWFPLVLAALLLMTDWKNIIFILLVAGLILNIVNYSWFPMRHTAGEFCWLFALLLASFSSRYKTIE